MLGKAVKKKAASAIEDDAKSFVGTKRLLGDGPSSDVKRLRLLKNPLIEQEGPDDCAVALVEDSFLWPAPFKRGQTQRLMETVGRNLLLLVSVCKRNKWSIIICYGARGGHRNHE